MSKIIASIGIRGAHKVVSQARAKWQEAKGRFGSSAPVGFPNTAYYLPIIYGILGKKVETLADMEPVLERCVSLLPPQVRDEHPLPYLGPLLDAGMATLFAEEIIEAIHYLEEPDFYATTEDPSEGKPWLGAADDVILRKRGVEFVDGTAPGFAAIAGAAPSKEVALSISEELRRRNLYVLMCARSKGEGFSEQLAASGVQLGWSTRLVPLGPDISAAVFALGFATRVAMSFGGIKPGDYRKILIYNKDRVFSFVLALGEVTEEWAATAAGALNWGFPIITDAPIPQILPSGICTYEHVVSGVPYENIVSRAIEVRGLKVEVSEVPVPVAYGPAFEGERVRKENIYLECGGGRTPMVEWVISRPQDKVEDGLIEVIGPEITDVPPGSALPLAIMVEVSGRRMQEDYEPILERQIHHLLNYAQGVMHIGQRDIAWLRVSQAAVDKGFRLHHIGSILHAKLHQDFGQIFDKIQIKLYTTEEEVRKIVRQAKASYAARDARIEGLTDEVVDTFYSCTLCQSFAPNHVCIISPERTGLCGSYNWMDCRVAYEINPTGPNKPVRKGAVVDPRLGQWQGVNEFVSQASHNATEGVSLYSILAQPMTACGCMECIAAILPLCNGIMTVNREYTGPTPCGMKFTTLAGTIGGGISAPGFLGHSKYNICQRKFIAAEGGISRLVWMPRMLKEEIGDRFQARAEEVGIPDLLERVADETIGTTEEEILPFLQEKGHPAINLEPLI